MNAKQALNRPDITKEMKIKVGSSNSYFYVGTVGGYLDNQKEISGVLYSKLQERAATFRKAYENRVKKPPQVALFCKKQEESGHRFTIQAYLDYVDEWLKKTGYMLMSAERAQNGVDTFKPLERRMVREIRVADPAVDPDCLIMIVEGMEQGAFWTTDDAFPGSVDIRGATVEDEQGGA